MKIIGLVGYKGSGKTTVAKILHDRGYIKIAFANKLKIVAKQIYNLTNEQVYGPAKDLVDHRYGITPRFILQRLGTEVCRSIHPDTWVMDLENTIVTRSNIKSKCYVIDDVRYPNEVNLVHRLGGEVWLINRPDLQNRDSHDSEKPELLKVDHVIENDESIKTLTNQVFTQLEQFHIKGEELFNGF